MTYLTAAQVQARFQISPTTLWRWTNDDELAFPKPLKVKRRKLFEEEKIVTWEQQRSGQVAA